MIKWLVVSLVIFLSPHFLSGIKVDGFGAAFIAALVLGIVTVLIGPILHIIGLPLTILTLGLFTFVINAVLIMLTASLVTGFAVVSFWWALLLGLIIAVINSLF